MSRQRRSVALPVVVLTLFGGLFLYLVAYCAFGLVGVVVLAVLAGGGGAIARSEAARIARDRQRYDNDYVNYHAHHAAPRRTRRTR